MDGLLQDLRRISKYYTGLPRDNPVAPVYEFKSEREFVELLNEGDPVVVAFSVRCAHSQHLDRVMQAAADEWHPHIRFLRVECPKYPGFCIARQRKDYPFVEIFHNSRLPAHREEAGAGSAAVTRYTVSVLPYTHDISTYGFREFFQKYGLTERRQDSGKRSLLQ